MTTIGVSSDASLQCWTSGHVTGRRQRRPAEDPRRTRDHHASARL